MKLAGGALGTGAAKVARAEERAKGGKRYCILDGTGAVWSDQISVGAFK